MTQISTQMNKKIATEVVCTTQYIARYALMLATGLLVACASVGPDKVVSTHVAYNEAVQLTITREVLVNVVRARYTDPMSFLKVETVNAQFSVTAGVTAGAGGIGQAGAAAEVGTSVGYSDSPTITFIPQTDAAFYKSMHSPMEVEDVFGLLHWGRLMRGSPGYEDWILRLLFASINGAAEIKMGQRNKLYDQRIDALARLMAGGATLRQVAEFSFRGPATPRDKLTGEDLVYASDRSLYFIEQGDGKRVRMALYRLVVALVLPDPSDPKVLDALKDLGVEPGRAQYIFRPPMHARPGSLDPFAIWVTPRSLADIMALSGQFVSVPAAHNEIIGSMDRTIDAPIQIGYSATEPAFPYRVQHRDYWFYVDDSDPESKLFMRFLVGLYRSRIGSRQAQDAAPQLVLPVGGG